MLLPDDLFDHGRDGGIADVNPKTVPQDLLRALQVLGSFYATSIRNPEVKPMRTKAASRICPLRAQEPNRRPEMSAIKPMATRTKCLGVCLATKIRRFRPLTYPRNPGMVEELRPWKECIRALGTPVTL